MSAKKEVAALLEQKQPQAKNHDVSIASGSGFVKLELAQLRKYANVQAKEMVEVVRELYPSYDKTIQSRVEHGSETGIQLRPDATNALVQRFAPELLRPSRKPQRKKPNRIQARLPDELYGQLQLHLEHTSLTVQDFIEELVRQFFKPTGAVLDSANRSSVVAKRLESPSGFQPFDTPKE